MSQKDFSGKLGIERSTYNTLELNKVQGNAETLLKIARALNRKVEDIWYLED